ncbi:ABC transporter substrate-binding protein [Piscinibacter terrae]|uniref:Extracellular solute-binding protein n=1 Tax=Piscinibacter terrae TaxID=2496871 RepID=A0A3N7HQE7_9BURK|nr:ABC transporter substrate-binding protein [Albitalea terrae]RQP24414.1 extracellular solute-binding protein [Albitalea terrae]
MNYKGLLATAAMLATITAFAQDGQVNIICSAQGEWCSTAQAAFAKSTGIKVNMVQKSTGEALAQILAERSNPKTDVWFGGTGDPHMLAAEQELTLEYQSPLLGQLHPWAQKQAQQAKFRTIALYLGPLGFAYNSELLAKKKLPVPKTWADLLRPEYKGEIQMSNPTSSGTAYTTIATLVQLMGTDKAWEYMGKLHKNIATYQRSGLGPLKAVARGEATISISFLGDVPLEKLQGFPVEMVAPSDGTGAELASMSIVKGAKNLDNAKKFYEWALTPQAQQLGFTAKVFTLPSNPATPLDSHMPDLKKVKLIDYDYAKYGSATERRRLIVNWERNVFSQPQ